MKRFTQLIFLFTLVFSTELVLAKGLSVDNPYVREVPPGQMISASFLTLKNDTDKNIALIKASSDVAKTVELHEHIHENGMMKMRLVPKIMVLANASTELKPGGFHIMLIGLQRKIKAGDKVKIDLEFDNGVKKTITATVKKIMMGMKMGGMKGKKMDTAHLNPMPNLMQIFKKMPDKLNLSKEQIESIEKGIKVRGPKIKKLFASLKKNENDILEATLSGKSISDIDKIADSIMQDRLAIMKGKTACRETTKGILDQKQFKTLIDIYRTKMMPKAKTMDETQAKMAMIKHTNPMPNLMQVIKKMGGQLNLTEKQTSKLKAWNEERGPVMAKQYKAVVKFEKEIQQASLNNEPVEKIYQLADAITMERMKIIRGKSFCRDKMISILKPDQYQKVVELYRTNFIKSM